MSATWVLARGKTENVVKEAAGALLGSRTNPAEAAALWRIEGEVFWGEARAVAMRWAD